LLQTIALAKAFFGPVAFSKDGKVFASGTYRPNGKIYLWDTSTGKELLSLQGYHSGARSLAFSPDGKLLVSCMNDTSALVWDVTRKNSK
jgi:WD40 repeat protein